MKPCFTRKNRCPAANGRRTSFHQAIRCPQRKVHNPPTTAWTLRDGHRITSRFTSIGNHICLSIYIYIPHDLKRFSGWLRGISPPFPSELLSNFVILPSQDSPFSSHLPRETGLFGELGAKVQLTGKCRS